MSDMQEHCSGCGKPFYRCQCDRDSRCDCRASACSRKEFESWFHVVRFGHRIDLTRGANGAYIECEPYWAWMGWQGKHFDNENAKDNRS